MGSSARYQLSEVIVEPLLKEGKELAEVPFYTLILPLSLHHR